MLDNARCVAAVKNEGGALNESNLGSHPKSMRVRCIPEEAL
jgi:hypothetical protein